ncbi:MAG: iron ABC transporter permease [Pseudomonadota bacterium]
MLRRHFYIFILGSPLVLILFSIFLGRYPIAVSDVLTLLVSLVSGEKTDPTNLAVIVYIRLPRILLAALVGGSLAVSGAAFQGLFRNPLVSSGMLGVSSGAGFGAALALILFNDFFYVYPFSFGFGLVAVFLCFVIGRFSASSQAITMVLGGVIVGSIFSALISFLKYVADPFDELPAIVFWLMGSLSRAEYSQIITAGIPMILGSAGLILIRWRLNVMAMGDKEARALGLNVNVFRIFIIACATLATAGAVCVSGVIGWVGLVVPHMSRMVIGNNNKDLIPVTFCMGACFLVIVDDISRIISSSEMPLGILTSLIGGPFFIYLLKKTKGREW